MTKALNKSIQRVPSEYFIGFRSVGGHTQGLTQAVTTS